MTDSDDSYELPNNVFSTCQNGSVSLCAKGPNVNTTNFSFLSLRGKNMSTSGVRQNFQQPRYAESVYDQRSVYSRRETSPMSLCSASGLQRRNYNSYYRGGMGSQRSVYHGRSRSPMSIQSNVSNFTAMDITTAIATNKFNREEWAGIEKAFFKKYRNRNRVRKRQNIRKFLKGSGYRSGGESGEQGSNSSMSDDDCRSIRSYRTTGYKENKPSHYRPTRSNLLDFRKTMQDSNMYRDCTDSLKQNTFRSMLSIQPSIVEESPQSSRSCNNPVMIQRDRFKSGFLLPSQRFNQSVASSTIPEIRTQWQSRNNEVHKLNATNANPLNKQKAASNRNSVTDSEQEEIFSVKPHGNNSQSKRVLDDNDIRIPNNKRHKLSSSPKANAKSKAPASNNKKTNTPLKPNGKSNDFVFIKPQFPLQKLGNARKPAKVAPKSTHPNKKLVSHSETDISRNHQPDDGNILECPQNTDKLISKSQQPTDTNITSESNDKSNDTVFAKPQFRRKTGLDINKKVTLKSTQLKKITTTQQQIKLSNTHEPTKSSIPECKNTEEFNPISDSQKPEECLSTLCQQPTEKLISNSRLPLDATACLILPQNVIEIDQHKDQSELTQHSTTDISMRPSFIKRKLFTQKVDITENKNSSSENLDVNSPQPNIYSAIQKEKSKTRKLVTSQSCLNRDIFRDDSNLLELIHKIVPPDRMNITTVTNRSEVQTAKSKPANADKWDISTVIGTRNNDDDVSDTYTDEEIFKTDDKVKKIEPKKKNDEKQNQVPAKCTVSVARLHVPLVKENVLDSREEKIDSIKRSVYDCVKSFWDSDSECETNLNNQGENGKWNQKQNLKNDHYQTPKESISKTIDKENYAPIAENIILPHTKSKSNKPAQIVGRNNKKSVLTKNPSFKSPPNDTTAVAEKNNNTESSTLSNSKTTIIRQTAAKVQANENKSRGVKSSQKAKNNTKIIPKHVQTDSCKQNITSEAKQTDKAGQKCNINQTKNNNAELKTVNDTLQKSNDSARSVRATRKARLKLCCVQSSDTEHSLNETSTNEGADYRRLRSRVIDLSNSDLSDKKNSQNKNITTNKNNSRRKVDNLEMSDVSFTLTTDNKRPSRLRNNIGKILMTTKQSMTSFPLTSDKSLNKTAQNKTSLPNSKNTKTSKKNKETKAYKIDTLLAESNEKVANNKSSNESRISKGKIAGSKKR